MLFNILLHRLPDYVLHPDQDQCAQETEHKILLDEGRNCWCIGPGDDPVRGDEFTVRPSESKGAFVVEFGGLHGIIVSIVERFLKLFKLCGSASAGSWWRKTPITSLGPRQRLSIREKINEQVSYVFR